MKEQRSGFAFRRFLPIAQLLICGLALWPSRYFLLWEVSRSVEAYLPVRAQPQQSGATVNIDIPSLTTQQEQAANRAARIEEMGMKVPVALNFPALIAQLPYVLVTPSKKEWFPRTMLPEVWRALSWPYVGLLFWWVAGRGIDALRAARRSILAPRITLAETVFASLLFCTGVVGIIGVISSTPDDRSDLQFIATLAGATLWGVLSAIVLSARILQWRAGKRDPVPVPA